MPWLVWSSHNNEVIASGELNSYSELSNLTSYAQGRQVTVLINSADVRLHRHYMATKPSRQIIKALPFMLEDDLAQDIDSVLLATGETGFDKESEQHWIDLAIVEKALIQNCLEQLKAADINVKKVLPEVLCLPYEPSEDTQLICAIELTDGWLVRTGEWQGAFVEKSWFALFSQQWLKNEEQDQEGEEAAQASTELKYYSALPDEISASLIESSNVSLTGMEPELPMLLLAKGAESNSWNLLQGDLAPKKAISKSWLMWRSAAALFVCALLIEFVTMGVNWYQSEAQLAIAKQQLIDDYQQAFPKEKVRVALLKRQLTRKVVEATGGQTESSGGFLTMMVKISPVLQEFKDVKSESYRFDGKRGELRISASAPSFQKFEQFKIGLEKLGLSVQQGAVNNEGSLVTGSLSVKEAS